MRDNLSFYTSVLLLFFQGLNLSYAQKKFVNIDSVSNQFLLQIEKFDYSKIELIPVYDCHLDEAEQFVNEFAEIKKENLQNFTPEIYERLKLETINQRIVLNSYLQSIDFWLYKRAMEYMKLGDTINAKLGFELSLRYNSFFVPSIYQLSKLAFAKDDYRFALQLVRDVFCKLYYEEQQLYLLDILQKQQYEILISRSKNRIDEGLYKEALEYLEIAELYCQEPYFKHCNQKQLATYFSLARQGLYQAFILVCRQSLEANKVLLAQSYLLHALEIRKKFEEQIVQNPAEKRYSNQIISSLYHQSSNLQLRKREGEAQFYRSLADTLLAYSDEELQQEWSKKSSQIYSGESVSEELVFANGQVADSKPIIRKNNLKRDKQGPKRSSKRSVTTSSPGDMMIREGKSLINRNRYADALQMLLLAHETYRQKGQKFPMELDPLLESTAIAYFSEPLSKASFYLWNKNIREADSIRNIYYTMAKDGNLLRLNGVNLLFDSYSQKRLRQQCMSYQDSLDYTLYKARSLAYSSNYIDAMQLIDTFLQDTSDAKFCSVSLSEILKFKKDIIPATEFQLLSQNVAIACANRDTLACIKGMVEKDIYMEKVSGSLFRINAISSEQSLLFVKDTVGLRLLCHEWIALKRYDKAISCIRALRGLGQDARKTSALQQFIGNLMYDLSIQNTNIHLSDELKTDKYYRTLMKAYYHKNSFVDKIMRKLGIKN